MKLVSKTASRTGRVTESQYDGTVKFFVSELRNLITSTEPACTHTLRNLAKEFEHDYDMQHMILYVIMECIASKHGERWKDLGLFYPENTRLTDHPELSAALMAGQRSFTAAEWNRFDVHFLDQTSCVAVGHSSFQVDVSNLDPKAHMAPVEVLHSIILDTMLMYQTNTNIVVMGLFLFECLHQPPWLSTFREDTYAEHAMRALKLVTLAMLDFHTHLEIQKSAMKACVHLCRALRPGATYKAHRNGGNDIMPAVLASMRRFPNCRELQWSGSILIIMDAQKVPGAAPLHPELVNYHNSIFRGIGPTLVEFCMQTFKPMYTRVTCDALRVLFETKIVVMTEMEMYVAFLVSVIREWDEVSEEHFAVRDRAIAALTSYFEAKDHPPFTSLQRAQHRDSMRKLINTHDMNKFKSDVAETEWLGQRILSYMCPYSTIPLIRDNTDRVCFSVLLLCELCQDSDDSRQRFIYESNGINICLSTVRYFMDRGSQDDIDVAVHALDLIASLYIQINCGVEEQVSPAILLTAGAPRFASSNLSNIALPRSPITSEPSSSMSLLAVQSGDTLISALQKMMRVVGAPQILLQSCMQILAAVTVLPENTRYIDKGLILAISARRAFPSRKILEDEGLRVLTHCQAYTSILGT